MNVDEAERPIWHDTFSEELREEQLQEDSDAWRAVTGLLLFIICLGVTLATFTVWICY
jgi:hypothetical protein